MGLVSSEAAWCACRGGIVRTAARMRSKPAQETGTFSGSGFIRQAPSRPKAGVLRLRAAWGKADPEQSTWSQPKIRLTVRREAPMTNSRMLHRKRLAFPPAAAFPYTLHVL